MTNHPNRSKQQQATHTPLTKAEAKMLLALVNIAQAGEWGAGDYQTFNGNDYNTMIRAADKLIAIAAAPETAAERDLLKALNAELLAALKDMVKQVHLFAEKAGYLGANDYTADARAVIAKAEEC